MTPAPAPAMDHAEDEGGGGARNQSSMVVVKTEAVCTNGGGPLVASPDLVIEDEGDETTECSSSFGDTCSGSEGEADGGEPEVNSGISARANGGRPSKPPRRKKVTAEWRNSVRPIMWRCQWLELRMKELSCQVSKYDRELALIKKEKEQQVLSKANGSMSESVQIHKGHGNSIMKRRKRKIHEENVDASLYINKHQILSYYHDKQNKGAETDAVLIDDECGSTVDGSIRGGLDTVTLLDSENYDMIFEQLTLKDTLMTIDGLQSRVHLLQDRLSNAHSGGENLALSEDGTHVMVTRKRQHTQKRSFSYTKCRYTKPQKRKNLNILLKDEDGSDLAGRPALPDRETSVRIKYENRNAEERSGECNYSMEKAVTVDLLLGTDNSIPNDHIGDLCKENTDDILIDNQVANEECQQLDKAKHLPSGTSSKGQNISGPAEMEDISAPAEVKNTCAPVETDSTSAPAVEPVSPQIKQELKPKKRRKKCSFFTKKQKKDASKTPAAKEKTEGTPSAAKNKTGSTPSAAAAVKTESTPSAGTGLGTMTFRSAGKMRKAGNEPADMKKRESGSESAAPKKHKTGRPSSAAKKQKTENPSSATKNQETENKPSTIKEAESAPLNMKIEKAVLVAVNSRRSQRVRKPKVFDE
ncbi:hypothetical protein SEVIR_5G152200v4 [Setaria viridis]|uniref:Uncharacterized protein n=1 Tax=Setaria viridis TaxID=4556 RepID=A0A4V6D6F5_SETVI|nr:uncharacterized protein LOC117857297 [Setaria viridis]TKW14196.1 hypothetical protein SEVIR_5G152200v2 [Setaria viridis]